MRRSSLIAVAATSCAVVLWAVQRPAPGCPAYIPSTTTLVAHAGGGLPDRTYANNRAAIDLAARHGFELIEIDFFEREGELRIGHEGHPESDMSPGDLVEWLDAHPGISIVTDVKTDNVSGLALLKTIAGDRLHRFIPQIYRPSEYAPVAGMGYQSPILTVYRMGDDGWQEKANALPLRAVTIPVGRRHLATGIDHPVFLHTVNVPMEGFGLYTDCLIPA